MYPNLFKTHPFILDSLEHFIIPYQIYPCNLAADSASYANKSAAGKFSFLDIQLDNPSTVFY